MCVFGIAVSLKFRSKLPSEAILVIVTREKRWGIGGAKGDVKGEMDINWNNLYVCWLMQGPVVFYTTVKHVNVM